MKCPTCRRQSQDGSAQCPRCGTELSELHRLIERAEQTLRQGWTFLANGDYEKASKAFLASRRLKKTQESARGLALSHLGAGQLIEALQWYGAAHRKQPQPKMPG